MKSSNLTKKPKPLTRGTRLSHRLSHALIPSTPPPPNTDSQAAPPNPRCRTAGPLLYFTFDKVDLCHISLPSLPVSTHPPSVRLPWQRPSPVSRSFLCSRLSPLAVARRPAPTRPPPSSPHPPTSEPRGSLMRMPVCPHHTQLTTVSAASPAPRPTSAMRIYHYVAHLLSSTTFLMLSSTGSSNLLR
jgi:hypothetical protein